MNKDMNEGVRLLIERMKTNPEEFDMGDGALYSSNKWGKLINGAMSDVNIFSKEEREAVKEAFLEARRNNFTADVIRTLHGEENPIIKKEWITEALVKGATIITTGGNGKVLVSNGGIK